MKNNIVYNAIQTPDGTIIQSKFRHDFVSYTVNKDSIINAYPLDNIK